MLRKTNPIKMMMIKTNGTYNWTFQMTICTQTTSTTATKIPKKKLKIESAHTHFVADKMNESEKKQRLTKTYRNKD